MASRSDRATVHKVERRLEGNDEARTGSRNRSPRSKSPDSRRADSTGPGVNHKILRSSSQPIDSETKAIKKSEGYRKDAAT